MQAFVWKHEKIQKIISHVLEQRLAGLTYDPVKSAQVAAALIPFSSLQAVVDILKFAFFHS